MASRDPIQGPGEEGGVFPLGGVEPSRGSLAGVGGGMLGQATLKL